MIANTTGCSSIFSASTPSILPQLMPLEGLRGGILCLKICEYGYGMFLGAKQLREKLFSLMNEAIQANLSDKAKDTFGEWLEAFDDGEKSKRHLTGDGSIRKQR